MTTIENFKCVFCKEVFNDKEILQEHFRKHGDPEFNKGKTKPQNEVPTSTEKSEVTELVSCDVCEEKFPSISKAITHKHKMHPEHDAKYFCPWCGKLFTMKHLYNVHIKSTHNAQTICEVKDFHCDKCSVYFFVPSAMVHHNKFFHRQDKDLYTLGSSKKVKMYNQELVSIFYCPFCGEEYNNKVNLQKHMEDDHSDENQSPEDVLRCPICEAVLYHLDAYELHLTFHSVEDQYTEQNEMISEITEFSLEAVPPLMEKVQDVNEDSPEDFLQVLVDTSEEPIKIKSKKHKKHKKSKKETITLDEFLNMNKDVFGDDLNVQGIEEIPTQMVLKRKYAAKNAENNNTKTVKQDLAKLKKQGITIKSNVSKDVPSTSTSNIVIHKKQLNNENLIPTKTSPTSIDPNDVISKLMGQGNSQIKIVKTSSQHNSESNQSCKIDSSSDYDPNQITTTTQEEIKEISENEQSKGNVHKEKNNMKETKSDEEEEIENKEKDINASSKQPDNLRKDDTIVSKSPDNIPIKALQNIGTGVTIKSLSEVTCENHNAIDTVKEHDTNEEDDLKDDSEHVSENEYTDNDPNKKNTNCMQSLNLNKCLTIRPVLKNNPSSPILQVTDQVSESEENVVSSKPESCLINVKQTSVKTENISTSKNYHHTSDEEENVDYENTIDEYASQHVENASEFSKRNEISSTQEKIIQTNADILKRLTNVSTKPIQPKTIPTNIQNVDHVPKAPKKDFIKSTMENDVEILHIEDSDSDADTDKFQEHNNSLRNKTRKSIGIKPNMINNKPITISSGLGNNKTVKSTNQQSTKIEVQTKDGQKECRKTFVSHTFDTNKVNISNSNKITEEQRKLQNTISNLKNITIKTNTSTALNFKEDCSQSEDNEYDDDEEYNSDTSIGKVHINELNEDEIGDDENQENHCDDNVKVESPQSFRNSEIDEDDNHDEFESEIKANAIKNANLPKQLPRQQKPINFPNINKEITIKPTTQRPATDDELHPQSKDSYEDATDTQKIKLQTINQQEINKNIAQSSQKASSNQVNTVKTVKTFKSQTLIEEVTTTVTKTIRTVNTQNVNNAIQTATRLIGPQKMQIIKKINPNPVRGQTPIVGNMVKHSGSKIRPTAANKSIAVRPRLANPQLLNSSILRMPPPVQSRPRAFNVCNRPYRVITPATKRAAEETGHFSCFKKAKESLFSSEDIVTKDGESLQFSNTKSKSTFSNVTQVQKSGIAQMKSESSTSSQHIFSKVSTPLAGSKIVRSSSKLNIEEKCETSAPKNSTMAALEKLQKQGLMIKKPRLEITDTENHSQSENEEYEGEEN